jgi:hypothetical protein
MATIGQLAFAGLQHRAHVVDRKIDECPDSRRQSAPREIDERQAPCNLRAAARTRSVRHCERP